MPRRMYYGPERATSIDLCVRDLVRASGFAGSTCVIAERIENPFGDCPISFFPTNGRSTLSRVNHIVRLATEQRLTSLSSRPICRLRLPSRGDALTPASCCIRTITRNRSTARSRSAGSFIALSSAIGMDASPELSMSASPARGISPPLGRTSESLRLLSTMHSISLSGAPKLPANLKSFA